jgi:hypothetical protein
MSPRRHCERSEAIHGRKKAGLLRRVASRNDGDKPVDNLVDKLWKTGG